MADSLKKGQHDTGYGKCDIKLNSINNHNMIKLNSLENGNIIVLKCSSILYWLINKFFNCYSISL